jgi:hypothetical protein
MIIDLAGMTHRRPIAGSQSHMLLGFRRTPGYALAAPKRTIRNDRPIT